MVTLLKAQKFESVILRPAKACLIIKSCILWASQARLLVKYRKELGKTHFWLKAFKRPLWCIVRVGFNENYCFKNRVFSPHWWRLNGCVGHSFICIVMPLPIPSVFNPRQRQKEIFTENKQSKLFALFPTYLIRVPLTTGCNFMLNFLCMEPARLGLLQSPS